MLAIRTCTRWKTHLGRAHRAGFALGRKADRLFSADASAPESRSSRSSWKNKDNRRSFFRTLQERLQLSSMDAWYSVTREQITKHGGVSILGKYHKNSISAALSEAFPEHAWEEWRFGITPRGFWRKVENQRRFLESALKTFGGSNLADWYRILPEQMSNFPAEYGRLCSVLKNYYNGSIVRALQTCFPEHAWKPWKFSVLPRTVVESIKIPREELREHLESMASQLRIQRLEDWYRISQDQLRNVDLFRLVVRYQGLANLLADAYPEHPWDNAKFSLRNKKSEQRILHQIVSQLFPQEVIYEDFKTSADVTFDKSSYRMDLDVYLPGLKLGFEYHGMQHYHDTYRFGQTYHRRRADLEKLRKCAAAGITVIELPYWAALTPQSVARAVASKRPDLTQWIAGMLAQEHSEAQVSLPPLLALPPIKPKQLEAFQRFRKVDIVTIEEAKTKDLSKFLIGEAQMSGVRFHWLPNSRQLIARTGYEIKAPVTFLDRLPQIEFEGILRFSGSTKIEATMESLFNEVTPRWSQAEFVALDLLNSQLPFDVRQENLKRLGCRTVAFRPFSSDVPLEDSQILVSSLGAYQAAPALRISRKNISLARIENLHPQRQSVSLRNQTGKLLELPLSSPSSCIPGEVFEILHDVEAGERLTNAELGRYRPEKSWDSIILGRCLREGSRLGMRKRTM